MRYEQSTETCKQGTNTVGLYNKVLTSEIKHTGILNVALASQLLSYIYSENSAVCNVCVFFIFVEIN